MCVFDSSLLKIKERFCPEGFGLITAGEIADLVISFVISVWKFFGEKELIFFGLAANG
jgi:hypothetical protein